MAKQHLITLALFLSLCGTSLLPAMDKGLFNAKDLPALEAGTPVIRSLKAYRELVIAGNGQHPFMTALRDMKPNYLAEAFILIPGADSKELLDRLSASLSDFDSWKGIPYWSARQETWYDLFSEAVVEEEHVEGTRASWITSFIMEPFTRYRTRTEIVREDSTLMFNSRNEDEISYAYNGMRAIKKHDMHWFVEAEAVAEGLLIYGVGAVYAFDMFGVIRSRLETSLTGRMSAFFSWQFDRLLPSKE